MLDKNKFLNSQMFLDWMRSLPENLSFRYTNRHACLISTWAKECGSKKPMTAASYFEDEDTWFKFVEDQFLWTVDFVIVRAPNEFTVSEVLPKLEAALEGVGPC